MWIHFGRNTLGTAYTLNANATLTGEPLLPDLRIALTTLFSGIR